MLISTEIRDGFTIKFCVDPELDDPTGHFDSGDSEADKEIIEKINNGQFEWFMVTIKASRQGIDLGHDYLGGCCYSSYDEFKKDRYYEDMVNNAINDAKTAIQNLQKEDI